jgi:hypothetical protein
VHAGRPHPGTLGRRAHDSRRDADGRKAVRVVDRHPADDWADVSKPALLAQLARAYVPPGS